MFLPVVEVFLGWLEVEMGVKKYVVSDVPEGVDKSVICPKSIGAFVDRPSQHRQFGVILRLTAFFNRHKFFTTRILPLFS